MKRENINDLAQITELKELKKIYNKIDKKYKIKILSKPTEQTLLVPVKDPISDSEFYAGEVLVTSTIVEVDKTKGWSMVIDSNEELSLYTAVLDASFEANIFKEEIKTLLETARSKENKKSRKLNQRVNSTRVSFDLM
ncbi:phosphonate C-P lyase system protein PhnG [Halarcobacter anaerophilus]|uniref:Phosphonate C-P lyase system protein PhnG n=1 Tax=Halarcobacter anaerophilus TaxID=877500 RepID=A0A4V1LQ56_9BACT|nr:phosphonate C-P lyase system protein PhnG [Halarcobacter anaerophilus]QDF28888.1 carbon-phosphorus lyase core complex subunit PhnG [Halarcobacter anaerophilus]RXJ63528.1 hypothetical protein CRV06_04880 [Halarcobacter anaerophilus]